MNNVYWFKGKTVSHPDLPSSTWESMLPISFQKITEIHYISHHKGLPEELSFPQAKSWFSPSPNFDLSLLLLNRLQTAQVENMLIIEELEDSLSFGFFGSALVVGKFNLPPEFEIHLSGWVSTPLFPSWLEKQKPQPIQIKIDEEIAHSTSRETEQQASSMMEAFLTAKIKSSNNLPFMFAAANPTTVSYLTLERI